MSQVWAKLLPLFVYPTGLTCVLLVLSLLVGARRPRLQRLLLLVGLLVLGISGNRLCAYALVRNLEQIHPVAKDLAPADVIVVLGGSTHVEGVPLAEGASPGRIRHAADLYGRGLAPRILLSGGGPEEDEASEAHLMAYLLTRMDVPREALWLEAASQNTRDNAVMSARILQEKKVSRVLLVTSALHMPRAVRAFRAAGVDVVPAPCDFVVFERRWQEAWKPDPVSQILGLVPSAGHVELTTRSMKEYLGLVVYRVRGWA